MADAAKQEALKDARRAQADFERKIEEAREARRRSFERAQQAGFSLRDIGKEVDLHWTRVGEILKGK